MKINERKVGGVTVLDVSGKITIGSGDIMLREAVNNALTAGATGILINLKDVTTIDSSGVGELVSSYATSSNRGVKLRLVNLPAKVQDILTITQLITVFDVYDNEDEAVKSFA